MSQGIIGKDWLLFPGTWHEENVPLHERANQSNPRADQTQHRLGHSSHLQFTDSPPQHTTGTGPHVPNNEHGKPGQGWAGGRETSGFPCVGIGSCFLPRPLCTLRYHSSCGAWVPFKFTTHPHFACGPDVQLSVKAGRLPGVLLPLTGALCCQTSFQAPHLPDRLSMVHHPTLQESLVLTRRKKPVPSHSPSFVDFFPSRLFLPHRFHISCCPFPCLYFPLFQRQATFWGLLFYSQGPRRNAHPRLRGTLAVLVDEIF